MNQINQFLASKNSGWIILAGLVGVGYYLYSRQAQSVPSLPLSLQQADLLVTPLIPPMPVNSDAS